MEGGLLWNSLELNLGLGLQQGCLDMRRCFARHQIGRAVRLLVRRCQHVLQQISQDSSVSCGRHSTETRAVALWILVSLI